MQRRRNEPRHEFRDGRARLRDRIEQHPGHSAGNLPGSRARATFVVRSLIHRRGSTTHAMPLDPKTSTEDGRSESRAESRRDAELGAYFRRVAGLTPSAGHDIRGRLHTISLNLQLLDAATKLEPGPELLAKIRRYATVLDGEQQRLRTLVDSLLRLVQISGETVNACDVRRLVEDVAGFLMTYAKTRQAHFELTLPERPLLIDACRDVLDPALVDIASQLIDAAGVGGTVVIEAGPSPSGGATIRMSVVRSPASPPEGSAVTVESAVARSLVEACGGRLEVAESGSPAAPELTFQLPRRPNHS